MINKIAILWVNPGRPDLEPEHPNDGIKYQRFFQTVFPQAQFKIYNIIGGEDFPQPGDHDLYFITGSRFAAYDEIDWVISLKAFIRQLDKHKKVLVGICFGHQVIAEALGGKVIKSEKGWGLGMKPINFTHKSWMTPPQQTLNIPHIHQDQVMQLPKGAELLAGSDFCPHESYTIGKHILAIQGHPEFSIDYLKVFLPLIKNRFPEAVYQQALTNIDQAHDGKVFAHWVKHFSEQSYQN